MPSGFASFPQGPLGDFVGKLEQSLPNLPRQEAKVAHFMLLNVHSIGPETGKSLAKRAGVSEITVGRLMRRLGYDGTKHLKELLRQHYSVEGGVASAPNEIGKELSKVMDAELSVIRTVFGQTGNADWLEANRLISDSRKIYVTGFQSVRGLSEDFARRLSIARPNVHYLSPHDGMLGEWLDTGAKEAKSECLVMIDVVPYASEGQKLAKIARQQGRSCIVVTDEFCHWSGEVANAALYAPSNTGLYLESTLGINLTLSLLVNNYSQANEEASKKRLASWKKNARRLGLF